MRKNLGLTQEQRDDLCQNLNIIINSAASVFKDEQLDLTVRVNAGGAIQLLKIAEDSPKFETFVQVSSVMVNCEKTGFIEESVYSNIKYRWQDKYDEILALNKRDLIKNSTELIMPFTNAYSFSKRMAEHLLIEHNTKNLPITFIRPSIIGAALDEPAIGWTDTLGLMSGVTLLAGLGIFKDMTGDDNIIGDIVPVDHVARQILV
jgi:thioester reductase-like protein